MRDRAVESERPFSEVLSDIVHNFQEIVRFEIRLARTEVREQADRVRYSAVMIGIAVIGALLSLAFLCIAALLALATVIPPWSAAICVAAALGLIAFSSLRIGISRLKRVEPLPKTATSVKENLTWTKQQSR